MNEQTKWWDELFTGPISLGLNKERLAELEEETFIYFSTDEQNEELTTRHS